MAAGNESLMASLRLTRTPVFEYGILRVRPAEDTEPHRDGMTVEEAKTWLAEWIEMGGKPDTFSIIRREIGPWEKP